MKSSPYSFDNPPECAVMIRGVIEFAAIAAMRKPQRTRMHTHRPLLHRCLSLAADDHTACTAMSHTGSHHRVLAVMIGFRGGQQFFVIAERNAVTLMGVRSAALYHLQSLAGFGRQLLQANLPQLRDIAARQCQCAPRYGNQRPHQLPQPNPVSRRLHIRCSFRNHADRLKLPITPL